MQGRIGVGEWCTFTPREKKKHFRLKTESLFISTYKDVIFSFVQKERLAGAASAVFRH